MADASIISLYTHRDIDPRLLDFQRKMVEQFLPEGVDFLQIDMQEVLSKFSLPPWANEGPQGCSSAYHAQCLDRCLYSLPYEHFILLDCDAVPLSEQFFEVMLANRNWICGIVQAANHLDDRRAQIPYTSPAAMSISKTTFLELETSFSPTRGDERIDCGAWVSIEAQRKGIPNLALYPTDVLFPRWHVGWQRYGFVTCYGDLLCHMWASRAVGTLIFEFFKDYVELCLERTGAKISEPETGGLRSRAANALSNPLGGTACAELMSAAPQDTNVAI